MDATKSIDSATFLEALAGYAREGWIWILEFVSEQPIWASALAVLATALALWLLSKLVKVAFYAVVVFSIVIGIAVFIAGPDKARAWLDELRAEQQAPVDGR